MSLITDALMVVYYAGREVQPLLTSQVDAQDTRKQCFREMSTEAAGGNKVFTTDVYGAAFNYVSINKVLDWFCDLPWNNYDSVVLTAQAEDPGLIVALALHGKVTVLENVLHDVWRNNYELEIRP